MADRVIICESASDVPALPWNKDKGKTYAINGKLNIFESWVEAKRYVLKELEKEVWDKCECWSNSAWARKDELFHLWVAHAITTPFGVCEVYAADGCDAEGRFLAAKDKKDAEALFRSRFFDCTGGYPEDTEPVVIQNNYEEGWYLALITPDTTTLPDFEFRFK